MTNKGIWDKLTSAEEVLNPIVHKKAIRLADCANPSRGGLRANSARCIKLVLASIPPPVLFLRSWSDTSASSRSIS